MLSIEYIAGFFDGEGSVSISGYNHTGKRTDSRGAVRNIDHIHWRHRLHITNTNQEILAKIQEVLGGTLRSPALRLGCKPCYFLDFYPLHSSGVAYLLLPHLVIKRPHVEIYIKFRETFRQPGQHTMPYSLLLHRYNLYIELFHLNQRGTKEMIPKLYLPSPPSYEITGRDHRVATNPLSRSSIASLVVFP